MKTAITCKFCAARCGMIVALEGDKISGISGNPEHPHSLGWTCARGKAAMVRYCNEIIASEPVFNITLSKGGAPPLLV